MIRQHHVNGDKLVVMVVVVTIVLVVLAAAVGAVTVCAKQQRMTDHRRLQATTDGCPVQSQEVSDRSFCCCWPQAPEHST